MSGARKPTKAAAPAEPEYVPSVEFKTAPVDYRFSTSVDKTKQCWSHYNEYLRCGKKIGLEKPACQNLYKYAKEMCPTADLNHYYEARRDDVWYGYKYPLQPSELREGDVVLTPDMPEHHAYEWNKRHPGHEWGVEHGKKKHH